MLYYALPFLLASFSYYFWSGLRQNIPLLQLSYYDSRKFLVEAASIIKSDANYLVTGTLITSMILGDVLSLENYLSGIGVVFLLLALRRKRQSHNKHVLITQRIKRLLISICLLVILFVLGFSMVFHLGLLWNLPFIMAVINLFTPALVAFANLINKPMEALILKGNIKEVRRMLDEHPKLTVIGIAGSFGKTSMRRILTQMLGEDYRILEATESETTPMSVFRTIREKLTAAHQLLIMEIQAKMPGNIQNICEVVAPGIGIITSIEERHLGTFLDMEHVEKTMFELAEAVGESGTMYLNYDDEYILRHGVSQPVVKYGIDNSSALDVWAENIESGFHGSTFDLCFNDKQRINCKTNILGKLYILDIVAAAAIAVKLGVPYDRLGQLVGRLEHVPRRFQLLSPGSKYQIIDDTLNSSPEGCKQSLITLGGFPGYRVVIMAGIGEPGSRDAAVNNMLGRYAARNCDFIITIGKEHSAAIADGAISTGFGKDRIYKAKGAQDALARIDNLAESLTPDMSQMTVLLEADIIVSKPQ